MRRSAWIAVCLLVVAGVAWWARGEASQNPGAVSPDAPGPAVPGLAGTPRPPAFSEGRAVSELLALGASGEREAWGALARRAEQLSEAERQQIRETLTTQLAYVTHPSADYRGGAEAVALAAAVADRALVEDLLGLLDQWGRVVAKLPLTEQRDDVAVIEAVRQAVRRAGTPAHEERLAARLRYLERDGYVYGSETARDRSEKGSR